MIFRRVAACVSAIALLSSCSSGGSSDSPTNKVRSASSSGLVATTHGFQFANFGAANTSEVMDGEDLRAMFGDGVCTNGKTTPCAPTSEAAAWAQMVNQSRQAGHCEGMVVQAINRFTTKATPQTSELANEADTTHGIIRAFATQFFPKVREESNKWAKRSLSDIASELQESFASQNITYTMGLYTDKGGHAVLPIAIDYPTPSTAKVQIYDTNWPGADRYVLLDLTADTWEFSFSGRDPENDPSLWTGGKGDIDLSSMESRLTTDAPFDTGSNGVLGNFLVIRSASLDWSIETTEGTVSPTTSTANASVQPLRSASTKALPEFIVSTTSTELSLKLPSASSVYAVSSNKIVSVITSGAAQAIEITENSVSLPQSVELSVASDDLAATIRGGAATVSVDDTALSVNVAGVPQPIVIDDKKPQATIVVKGGTAATTAGSAITTAFPTLPASLVPPDTKNGLPPQDDRDISTTPEASTTSSTPPSSTSVVPNAPSSTTTTTSTTTIAQNIVALQNTSNQFTATNGQQLPTLSFRLINASNQWASTASGTCTMVLLPEFDNGSLNGASLSGGTSATANGNGICSFSTLVVNGTPGTKYRLRANLTGSGANTTLTAFTLN
jgi:hypothetical protein